MGCVSSLSARADGSGAIIGTAKSFIYSLDLAARSLAAGLRQLSENHAAAILDVRFPATVSDRFATASADGTVRVWDLNDYSVVCRAAGPDGVTATTVDFAGECLVSGWSDGKVRTYDSVTGELLWKIDDVHRTGVTALCVAFNHRFFVSGGMDGAIRVWDMRSRELVAHLKEHTMQVTAVQLFEDDVHVLSSSKDRSILCWDLRKEKRVANHTQRMGGLNCVAIYKDQMQFVSVGQERSLTWWDLREVQPLRVMPEAHGKEHCSTCVALTQFDAKAQLIATGGTDGIVQIWSFDSGQVIQRNQGHSAPVAAVRFSPDGRQLISVSSDGNILIWNVYL
jgi:WD40 repeat protein